MKNRFCWLMVFTALLIPSIAWGDIELTGFLENQERIRIPVIDQGQYQNEKAKWDLMMADSWLDLVLRGSEFDGKARMLADIDLKHFALSRDETIEARIREAWAGFYLDFFSLEIGKKIYNWGMADEMNPTDLICAEDLRWFYTYDKADRKLGAYSAAVSFSYSNFKIEGVWIPFFAESILPENGDYWVPWKLQLFYDMIDEYPDYIDHRQNNYPELNVENSSGAVRFSGVAGPVDFAVMYYNGWDHFPVYDIIVEPDVEQAVLEGRKPLILKEEFQRYNAFGASLAAAAGPVTIRAEGAYYTDRYFMHEMNEDLLNPGNMLSAFNIIKDLEGESFRTKKSSFNAVGGLDYRYSSWFYGNLQYFHMQILNYEDVLLDNEIENGISGRIEFILLEDTLRLGINGAFNLSQLDWYAKPFVAYLLTDALELQVGASFFGGDYETNFGEFDKNDHLFTKLRFSF